MHRKIWSSFTLLSLTHIQFFFSLSVHPFTVFKQDHIHTFYNIDTLNFLTNSSVSLSSVFAQFWNNRVTFSKAISWKGQLACPKFHMKVNSDRWHRLACKCWETPWKKPGAPAVRPNAKQPACFSHTNPGKTKMSLLKYHEISEYFMRLYHIRSDVWPVGSL